MSVDGRFDARGPGNSGFVMIRSNCKTKMFMSTMMSLISLVIIGRSDQVLWNVLIDEKIFRQMHVEMLPIKLFVNGNHVSIKRSKQTKRDDLSSDHITVHACWTTDQFDKIEKFWNTDHWYFSQTKCPSHYNISLVPDLKSRNSVVRAKQELQEQKLKELGIVKDTSLRL